jgi:hypothetical protein
MSPAKRLADPRIKAGIKSAFAASKTATMGQNPSKEKIREWLVQRHAKRDPLPDIAQIKQQLDWQPSAQDDVKVSVNSTGP